MRDSSFEREVTVPEGAGVRGNRDNIVAQGPVHQRGEYLLRSELDEHVAPVGAHGFEGCHEFDRLHQLFHQGGVVLGRIRAILATGCVRVDGSRGCPYSDRFDGRCERFYRVCDVRGVKRCGHREFTSGESALCCTRDDIVDRRATAADHHLVRRIVVADPYVIEVFDHGVDIGAVSSNCEHRPAVPGGPRCHRRAASTGESEVVGCRECTRRPESSQLTETVPSERICGEPEFLQEPILTDR